jgi:hypothetical protein
MLRHRLYEAASALMTRIRKWFRLCAWGIEFAKRRGMKRATSAVARKLAVIMHDIWVPGEGFDFGGPAVRSDPPLTELAPLSPRGRCAGLPAPWFEERKCRR